MKLCDPKYGLMRTKIFGDTVVQIIHNLKKKFFFHFSYNKHVQHGAILEAYIFLKLGFDAADHFLFNGAANDHPHRFQTEGI